LPRRDKAYSASAQPDRRERLKAALRRRGGRGQPPCQGDMALPALCGHWRQVTMLRCSLIEADIGKGTPQSSRQVPALRRGADSCCASVTTRSGGPFDKWMFFAGSCTAVSLSSAADGIDALPKRQTALPLLDQQISRASDPLDDKAQQSANLLAIIPCRRPK
jgi:hypothetical protein